MTRPFGGLQLILSGDFYQLPPVKGRFAFSSRVWQQANLRPFVLKEVVRQKGDLEFIEILNSIRTGNFSDSGTLDKINACHEDHKSFANDQILPTKVRRKEGGATNHLLARNLTIRYSPLRSSQLYCKNRDVDSENNYQLNKLPSKACTFLSQDVWKGTHRSQVERDRLKETVDKKCGDVLGELE